MNLPSKYFGSREQAALKIKIQERKNHLRVHSDLMEAMEHRALTETENIERYFTALATRLLRAKFYSFPALSNEELAYLVGCPTGTYLSMLMTRKRSCSESLAKLMDKELRKFEMKEGMPPIYQPEYP